MSGSGLISSRWRHVFVLCGTLSAIFALATMWLGAQEIERVELPLIDQQPFDLIVLTAEEGGESVKVLPLDFREMPSSPSPTKRFEVVLVKYQERRYEIAWKSIREILFYEQRIYDEALEKMADKDFATAFQNLSFLMKNYPDMPRLEELRQQFIYESAIDRFERGELRQTLSALEELKSTAPGFRSTAVTGALSRVADALIGEYQQQGRLGTAKELLNRIRQRYGPTLPVVAAWDQRLEEMALAKKDTAEALMVAGKYREARKAAIEMLSIFPGLEEAQELIRTINTEYPMVRVGVMQRGGNLDPASLIDWPARRAGLLVEQPLFQFLETGSEGGRYGFALGTYRHSDDRMQLLLSLDPQRRSSMSAFDVSQMIFDRADPDHAEYDASFASIFKAVLPRNANQVLVDLKRPNVLPHALMQWTVDREARPGWLGGEYELSFSDEAESAFKLQAATASGQPKEIVEVFYDDPKMAVNDLLLGEIDLIDQLYPADAARLALQDGITIGSYALPTSHMLIPVSEHAYLQSSKFRRALLYATDRESMLRGELLNSNDLGDGRLLSGPFPLGDGESDPLAYAYNADIAPTAYSPQLARLLLVMTTQELYEMAQRKREDVPTLETLVVGCPDYEFARVAVQAMIQQWQNVGIQAEMKILAPSELAGDGCDLVYVITTMWEPATDIERLLGAGGIASTDDPFVIQALEQLRACRNWREVRTVMQSLHRLIDYHLPVLPLWQVTDRFAVGPKLAGVRDRPVSLYQNVANWRVELGGSMGVASR